MNVRSAEEVCTWFKESCVRDLVRVCFAYCGWVGQVIWGRLLTWTKCGAEGNG